MMSGDTSGLTPGDRRELRSLVKKQFAVLRADVKRREQELKGEIEAELLRRYRDQDERIKQARREVETAKATYLRALQGVVDSLREAEPGLEVGIDRYSNSVAVSDPNRAQLHRALLAAVPQQIANANTRLDQEELDLLRDLTIGALDTEQARQFLGRIPTVGELVPQARLAEIAADGPQ